MQHRRIRRKLGVKSQHRRALLRNLVRNLVISKRIRTTLCKAKEASSFTESMIELAKRGDLHAHRLLISKLGSSKTARSLIRDIAPHFKDRRGGYTRILRLNHRPGDGAQMAYLEFSVPIEAGKKEKKKKKKKSSKAEAPPKEKAPGKTDKDAEKAGEQPKKPGERKETEKRGGFLGTLRKFLKGDE